MATSNEVLVPLFPEERGIHATLLRIGELTFLLDCGWTFPFSRDDLTAYDKVLDTVDILLISHADMAFCGALFYCLVSNKKLMVIIPEGLPYLVKLALYETKQNLSTDYYGDVSPMLRYPINDEIEKDLKQRIREVPFRAIKSFFGDKVRFACTPSGAGLLGAIWCLWVSGIAGGIVYAPRVNTGHSGILHTVGMDTLTALIQDCTSSVGDVQSSHKNGVSLLILGCEKTIQISPTRLHHVQEPHYRFKFKDALKRVIRECSEACADAIFVCDGTCRGVEVLTAVNELLLACNPGSGSSSADADGSMDAGAGEVLGDADAVRFSAFLVGASADTLLRFIPGALQKVGDSDAAPWGNIETTGTASATSAANTGGAGGRSGKGSAPVGNTAGEFNRGTVMSSVLGGINGCLIKPLETITALHSIQSTPTVSTMAGVQAPSNLSGPGSRAASGLSRYMPRVLITVDNTLSAGISLTALKIMSSNAGPKRSSSIFATKSVRVVSFGLACPEGSVTDEIFKKHCDRVARDGEKSKDVESMDTGTGGKPPLEVPIIKFTARDITAREALDMYGTHSSSRSEETEESDKSEQLHEPETANAAPDRNKVTNATKKMGNMPSGPKRKGGYRSSSATHNKEEVEEVEKTRELRGDIMRAFDYIVAGSYHFRQPTAKGSSALGAVGKIGVYGSAAGVGTGGGGVGFNGLVMPGLTTKFSPIFPLPLGVNDNPYPIWSVSPLYRSAVPGDVGATIKGLAGGVRISQHQEDRLPLSMALTSLSPNVILPCLHTLPPNLSGLCKFSGFGGFSGGKGNSKMLISNLSQQQRDYQAYMYGIEPGDTVTRLHTTKKLKVVSTSSVSLKSGGSGAFGTNGGRSCKPPKDIAGLVIGVEIVKDRAGSGTWTPAPFLSPDIKSKKSRRKHAILVEKPRPADGNQGGGEGGRFTILTEAKAGEIAALTPSDDDHLYLNVETDVVLFPGCLSLSTRGLSARNTSANIVQDAETSLKAVTDFIDSLSTICNTSVNGTAVTSSVSSESTLGDGDGVTSWSYREAMSADSVIDNRQGTICVLIGSSKDIGVDVGLESDEDNEEEEYVGRSRRLGGAVDLWQLFGNVKPFFLYDSQSVYGVEHGEPNEDEGDDVDEDDQDSEESSNADEAEDGDDSSPRKKSNAGRAKRKSSNIILKGLDSASSHLPLFTPFIRHAMFLSLEKTGRRASLTVRSVMGQPSCYSFVFVASENIFKSRLANEQAREKELDTQGDQDLVVCARDEVEKEAYIEATGLKTFYEIEERVFGWPSTVAFEEEDDPEALRTKMNLAADENLGKLAKDIGHKVEVEVHKDKNGKIKVAECIKTAASIEAGKINALVTIIDPSITDTVRSSPDQRKSGLRNLIGALEVRRNLHEKTEIY